MILLGLGSNLPSSYGDRFKNIDLAILSLNKYGIQVKKNLATMSHFHTPTRQILSLLIL